MGNIAQHCVQMTPLWKDGRPSKKNKEYDNGGRKMLVLARCSHGATKHQDATTKKKKRSSNATLTRILLFVLQLESQTLLHHYPWHQTLHLQGQNPKMQTNCSACSVQCSVMRSRRNEEAEGGGGSKVAAKGSWDRKKGSRQREREAVDGRTRDFFK